MFLGSLVQDLAGLREAAVLGLQSLQAEQHRLEEEIRKAQERHQTVREPEFRRQIPPHALHAGPSSQTVVEEALFLLALVAGGDVRQPEQQLKIRRCESAFQSRRNAEANMTMTWNKKKRCSANAASPLKQK